MTFFRSLGGFTVILSAEQEEVRTRLELQTLRHLWQALEAHLASGKAVWEPFKSYRKKLARTLHQDQRAAKS